MERHAPFGREELATGPSRGRWRQGARRLRLVRPGPAARPVGGLDNVAAHLADGLAADGRAVLRARPGGRLEPLTPEGAVWIEQAWGCWLGPDRPPPTVAAWLTGELTNPNPGRLEPHHRRLISRDPRAPISLRLVPGVDGRDPVVIAQQVSERDAGLALAGADLTPRETDVLSELSHGHTNARIARRLGISERTVKTHVEHIFSKLGVDNRAAAAVAAAEALAFSQLAAS